MNGVIKIQSYILIVLVFRKILKGIIGPANIKILLIKIPNEEIYGTL